MFRCFYPVALVGYALLAPLQAAASFFVVDQFEDGSITDGSPLSWELIPTFTGSYGDIAEATVQGGSLVLTTEGAIPVMRADGIPAVGPSDGLSIRTQFRMLEPGVVPAVAFNRNTGGRIFPDGSIDVVVNGSIVQPGTTDLRPLEEDVVMQIDVDGSSRRVMTMRVWRAGDPMPIEPTIITGASRVSYEAFLALNGAGAGAPGWGPFDSSAVAFRYAIISSEVIPEPTSAAVAVIGVLAAAARRR